VLSLTASQRVTATCTWRCLLHRRADPSVLVGWPRLAGWLAVAAADGRSWSWHWS
jgi:hypothetical protein